MKFQTGDKVKIKKLEPNKEYGELFFDEEMKYIADEEDTHTIVIVSKYNDEKVYGLELIDEYWFNDQMLERA